MGPLMFQIFNFFFVAIFQNILIFLFTLPIFGAVKNHVPLNTFDYGLILLWVILFLMETIADQQQWNFQQKKSRARKQKNPYIKRTI